MKRLLALTLLFFAVSVVAQKVNPHTQISWPANCNNAGNVVYNWLLNTCIPIASGGGGGGSTPGGANGEVQINANGVLGSIPGFTYNGTIIASLLPINISGTPGFSGFPGIVPDLTGTTKGGIYLNSTKNAPCYEFNTSTCNPIPVVSIMPVTSGHMAVFDANGNLVDGGVPSSGISGGYNVNITTASTVNAALQTFYYNNSSNPGGVSYSLPAVSSANVGQRSCFRNYTSRNAALTVSTVGGVIDVNGSSVGVATISGGALGDSACLTAVNPTGNVYMLDILRGTWGPGTGVTPPPTGGTLPTFYTYDQFIGASSSTLSSHTDNMGNTWALWTPRGTIQLLLNGSGAVNSTTGGSNYAASYNSATPPSADYTVDANCTAVSAVAGAFCGVYGRMPIGSTGGYAFFNVGGTCTLYAAAPAGFNSLGTSNCVWNTGSTHNLAVKMVGSSITGLVDGTSAVSATDTTYTAVGKGGLESNNPGSNDAMSRFEITPNTLPANQTYDRFVGSANSALTAHTDINGNSWNIWTPRATVSPNLNGYGAVVGTGSGNGFTSVYSSLTPSSADYTVMARCTIFSAGSGFCGVYARMQTGATTGYGFFYSNNTCYLYVAQTGTFTTLASGSCPWPSNTTHWLAITVAGSQITGVVDGTGTTMTAADSSITSAGHPGFETNQIPSYNYMDYFMVQ